MSDYLTKKETLFCYVGVVVLFLGVLLFPHHETNYPLSDEEAQKIIDDMNAALNKGNQVPMAFMNRNPKSPEVCIQYITNDNDPLRMFGTKYDVNFQTIKYGCVTISYFDMS